MEGHTNSVRSAGFSADGYVKVVSVSGNPFDSYGDNAVRIWSVATGECEQTMMGHIGAVNSVRFSPDGQKIVSASYDKTMRVWNAATGDCEQTIKGYVH